MTTYIAMLRGINVSGHKIIKMEALRKSFEKLKFLKVRTYVQSGNVVFESTEGSPGGLTEAISRRILDEYGFSVPVLLKTAREMERVVRDNPFVKLSGIDETKLHVTFLSQTAPKTAEQLLAPLAVGEEQFQIKGLAAYLYCPHGYGNTKLSNTAIEKKLGVGATTRNWKSVNALLAMAQEEE